MTAVEVSIVHDRGGRIISASQFAAGVRATVVGGEGESVLVTTVDHQAVALLVLTHKVDVQRGCLVEVADASSEVSRDQAALAALLLPKKGRG
jgi:hypothetical protein